MAHKLPNDPILYLSVRGQLRSVSDLRNQVLRSSVAAESDEEQDSWAALHFHLGVASLALKEAAQEVMKWVEQNSPSKSYSD